MHIVEAGHISDVVQDFLDVSNGEKPDKSSRSRSWDYCYNYFQDHPEPTQDLERSCLQLGYYLASWGMLRGSSYLFASTNMRHFVDTIRVIEDYNPIMRTMDADSYLNPDARAEIIQAYTALRKALVPDGIRHVTLVGKVMLGVWGCLPSYDRYFRQGFWQLANKRGEKTAFNRVSHDSLTLLGDFYSLNQDEISRVAAQYTTLTFSGDFTDRPMPMAKVIDMYGFQRGYRA